MAVPEEERKRHRWRFIIGIFVLLTIGGIVGYGFYDKFVAPPQVLAARVGDTRYTQGDLVNRLRMLQAAAVAQGQEFDFTGRVFEVLLGMADAELIRRSGPTHGVQVTEADLESVLRDQFFPDVPEGQEAPKGQVEQEYRLNYRRFLDRSHLSDKDYRQILEEELYKTKLREKLGEQAPSIGEQVEVHWIKVPSPGQGGLGVPSLLLDLEIRARLEDEDFAKVAQEVPSNDRYADKKGYVGWVPRGAFPDLDHILFGNEEEEAIAINVISAPINIQDGTFILKVTAGPEGRQIAENMRGKLKDQALDSWLAAEREIGSKAGWWEVNFRSDIYNWVANQVREAAPRVTPPPG